MGHDEHDAHGHDDHGDDHGAHGHDDHGHDENAHHGGPDVYIVNPSSEVVASRPNTALAYLAFFGILLVIAVIIKLVA
jgi:hypothetical protein